jgi:Flp pilus assembly protein TadD
MLLQLFVLLLSDLPPEYTELIGTAKEEINGQGKLSAETLSELREAVAEFPKDVELQTALGYSLLHVNELEAAVKAFEAVRGLVLGTRESRCDPLSQ